MLCIQIPGVYAALFEKVVGCVWVCECELDAAGYGIFNIERIERDYPHVYGIFELCGRYARGFSFVAW